MSGYSGLPPYYLLTSDPFTPNLGLSLKGMDPIVAENFVLIDTAVGSGGGGSKVYVNGSAITNPNFSDSATVTFSVIGSNIYATAAPTTAPGTASEIQTTDGSGHFVASAATADVSGNLSALSLTIGTQPSSASVTITGDASLDDILDLYQNNGQLAMTVDAYGDVNIFGTLSPNGIALYGYYVVFGVSANKTKLVDYTGSSGSSGQVLTSTADGVLWANGGGVSSWSGDGSLFVNSGSTGAVTATLGTQSANTVFSGPTSGAAHTPTFRSLVVADLPSLSTVAVTSLTGDSVVFNNSASQGAVTLSLASHAQNLFLASPSGSSGTPTFRAIVTADLPTTGTWAFAGTISGNLNFSGTPTFSNALSLPNGTTATTQSAKDNSTKLATTAYVDAAAALLETSGTANEFIATPNGASGVPVLRALVAADVPTLNQNTSGTAANLSGTPALPNGTTATTQAAGDNSTKLATTAYADASASTAAAAVKWSGLQNASAALTLSNAGNATTFNQTSAVSWTWANTTTATSGTTNASPVHEFAANYWTGSASAVDDWTIGSSLASGTNGASALTVGHAGSTGKAYLSLASSGVTGFQFQATPSAIDFGANTSWTLNFTNTNGTTTNGSLIGATGSFTFESGSGQNLVLRTTAAGKYVDIFGYQTTGTAYPSVVIESVGTFAATSGTQVGLGIGSNLVANGLTFGPSSGTANFVACQITPTINQTGSASGSYTALLVNVTETSVLGSLNNYLSLQTGAVPKFEINNSGVVGVYNSFTTVGVGMPSLLGQVNLTNTINVSNIILVNGTLGRAGFYRVSAYIVITTAASTSSVLPSVTVAWTDETDTAQSVTLATGGSTANTVGTYALGSITVYSAASTNLVCSTTGYTSVGGTQMVYSLRLRAEYLG